MFCKRDLNGQIMDRGKVAEECETHSPHAICSPDTAFLFPLVLTDLFKMELQLLSGNIYMHTAALLRERETDRLRDRQRERERERDRRYREIHHGKL